MIQEGNEEDSNDDEEGNEEDNNDDEEVNEDAGGYDGGEDGEFATIENGEYNDYYGGEYNDYEGGGGFSNLDERCLYDQQQNEEGALAIERGINYTKEELAVGEDQPLLNNSLDS